MAIVKSEVLVGIECIHKSGHVTATDCHRLSTDGNNNKECVSSNCQSLWRRCSACVAHGTVDAHSRIMSPDVGLCTVHVDKGEDFRKNRISPKSSVVVPISRARVPLQAESVMAKGMSSAKNFPLALQKMLAKAMSTASNPVEVRVDEVRRFVGQPRIQFDEISLRDLGESLKLGQIVPIILRKLTVKERGSGNALYELVDGECRWRACQVVDKKTIRAVFIAVPDKKVQFAISAMANFGRKPHTPLEEAFSIRFMHEELHLTMAEIGKAFAKSEAWAYQRANLLRLHPEVQKMLNPALPKEKQIVVAVAIYLVSFPDQEFQFRVAKEIVARDLGLQHAKAFIKREAATTGVALPRAKRGGPSSAAVLISSFINNTFPRVEAMLALRPEHTFRMFPDRASRSTALDNLEKIARKIDTFVHRVRAQTR